MEADVNQTCEGCKTFENYLEKEVTKIQVMLLL